MDVKTFERFKWRFSSNPLCHSYFHFISQTGNSHDSWHQCHPAAPSEADRSCTSCLQHRIIKHPPYWLSQPVWNRDADAAQHVPHVPATNGHPGTHTGIEDYTMSPSLLILNIKQWNSLYFPHSRAPSRLILNSPKSPRSRYPVGSMWTTHRTTPCSWRPPQTRA